jgi:hypothetical protein
LASVEREGRCVFSNSLKFFPARPQKEGIVWHVKEQAMISVIGLKTDVTAALNEVGNTHNQHRRDGRFKKGNEEPYPSKGIISVLVLYPLVSDRIEHKGGDDHEP